MYVKDIIKAVTDKWFLSEPLLFAAYCGHQLVENKLMKCSMRSGRRKIEYNPDILSKLGDIHIAELLRREVIRIILKHPYDRQPVNPVQEILYLASNVTIFQNKGTYVSPCLPAGVELPEGKSFEEYYNRILHELQDLVHKDSESDNSSCECSSGLSDLNSSQSGADYDNSEKETESGLNDEESIDKSGNKEESKSQGESSKQQCADTKTQPEKSSINDVVKNDNGTDATELWEEDGVQIEYINKCIEEAMLSGQWGSLGGNIKDLIKASTIRAENIRRKMDMFRTSIISTNRRLTRMRPSRRYGWTQMGVLHPYTSSLLVAVDTSCSVKKKDLIRFFGVINSFFTYGIPFIDVLQFDAKVNLPLLTLHNVTDKIELRGRGGTNFQAPVDFFIQHKEYDGMIVFTDGDAPVPDVPQHKKVLWVLQDIICYNYCNLNPKVYI